MNNLFFDRYLNDKLDDIMPFDVKGRKGRELVKYLKTIGYLRQIIAGALAMFNASDIPDGLDFRYLELFRYCNGHVGVMRHDKYGLVCFPGSFSGELDAYGRGTLYTGALLSGEPMEGIINEDVIIIYNNYIRTPDLPLFVSFAKRLAEVDTSLDSNVFYSRLAPIIKVANGKIKAAVDEVLADIDAGALKSIISDELELDIEGLKSIDIFNITDVKDVDKIQYLSKYHDDLLRRLYTLGGHAMAGTQKMAQQSAYEVGQNDTIAMIYPSERFITLSEGVEQVNKLFNTNMKVEYSEPWQVEKEKIETSIASANQLQAGVVVESIQAATDDVQHSVEEDTRDET